MKEKFAFIAFTQCSSELNNSLSFDNGLSIYSKKPFSVDERWKEWVGAKKSSEVENSNLIIYSSIPSNNPETLDHEHECMKRRAEEFYYSLALYGVPRYNDAFMIVGSKNEGKIYFREYTELFKFHVIYNGKPKIISERDLRETCKIYKSVSEVYSAFNIKQASYFRIRHGFNAYIKAIKEFENYYRLPQLVRAVEAIIKPRIGKTKKDFVHRCKLFVIPNPENEATLLEIYELRCRVEHLHLLMDVYPNESKEVASKKIDLRIGQLEEIVRNIYISLFSKSELLRWFLNDIQIEKFWSLDDEEREVLWAEKLDLSKLDNNY